MKHSYFVKFAPQIKKLTGCSRSTEILGKLEYWFRKYPDGFYKFIEPCSHRLYRGGDSWTEELDCDRKSFSTSFDKIAIRYKSRRAFEEAEDKFQDKMYASIYDRDTNQTYFIRNHTLANSFLSEILPAHKKLKENENNSSSKVADSFSSKPLRNGKNSRSYIEAKNTPSELFSNNSHASNEIIKKMIEIWTAIVGEGRGQNIELKGKIIPFLKKALKDKFNSCLQKWKEYCINIARSKFLMGEKTTFKADLEWALKFESIRKVLSGNYYGIGDREPKEIIATVDELQEEINNLPEPKDIKEIRTNCLKMVGNAPYIAWFKSLQFDITGAGELKVIAPHGFGADHLRIHYGSVFEQILEKSDSVINQITLFAYGDPKERKCFERKDTAGQLLLNNGTISNGDEWGKINQREHEPLILDDICDEQMDHLEKCEQQEERALIKKAIHSLLNVNSLGLGQGRGVLDFIPV